MNNQFNSNERFDTLYKFVHEHSKEEFTFVDSTGSSMIAMLDTAYETDNGKDESEEGYEEYLALAFCSKETGKLFEINYHTLPTAVFCNNEQII